MRALRCHRAGATLLEIVMTNSVPGNQGKEILEENKLKNLASNGAEDTVFRIAEMWESVGLTLYCLSLFRRAGIQIV